MWGANWGEMFWGNGSGFFQIPIGPWALLILGFLLGIFAVYVCRNKTPRSLALTLVLFLPTVAVIAASVPHEFKNNTLADANEVNMNFNELASAVTVLEQKVAVLESALSVTPAGDVSLTGQNVTIKAAIGARVEGISTTIKGDATVDISASATASMRAGILKLNSGGLPNARISDSVQVNCIIPSAPSSISCDGSIIGPGDVTTLN